MIKTQYAVKTHIVTENVPILEKQYCDRCGKEITGHYYSLITHHSDWGNDSSESFEYMDLCSVECLANEFEKYCSESNNPYNSMQFEVEHCNCPEARGEIKYAEN